MSNVLMIEDDENWREKAIESLAGRFHIEFATTLHDAIDILGKQKFDAVTVDPGLPDSETSKTFDKIKCKVKESGFKPAIIVISGHNDPDFIYDVIKKNAAGFHDKNTPDENCEALGRMLEVSIQTNRVNQGVDSLRLKLEN